jgi:molybdate transport system regulatory protein
MSYRYVWSYLQRINRTLGKPVADTFKGGKSGGGGARLTLTGKELLTEYRRIEEVLNKTLAELEHSGSLGSNQLQKPPSWKDRNRR